MIITKLHVTQQVIFARKNVDSNGDINADPVYLEFENAANVVRMLEVVYANIFAQCKDPTTVEGRIAGAIANDATFNVLLTQMLVDMCSKPFTSGFVGTVRHELFYSTLLQVAKNTPSVEEKFGERNFRVLTWGFLMSTERLSDSFFEGKL